MASARASILGLAMGTAALDGVNRLQRMIQAQQVNVLQFPEHLLQPPLGRGELRIALLHLEPSPVQRRD